MDTTWRKYEEYVDKILAAGHVPGAQICIMDQSGMVFSKNYGWRDQAQQFPVNDETVFGIASLSKSITCLALALLEQEGKVSFDDPVYRYFPDFRIPGTPREDVRISHLATHRSGIPPLPTISWSLVMNSEEDACRKGYNSLIRSQATHRVDKLQDILDVIREGKLYHSLGQPGEYYSYLNEGYAILSAVVDIASGETLESYAQREIFDKLGMTHTTFDLDKVKASENYTSLFYDWNGRLECSDNWEGSGPYRGCGFIKSTATDMVRYYFALSNNGVIDGKQVLPRACMERMFGEAFPTTEEAYYCFGMAKRKFGSKTVLQHTGGLKGVSSMGAFVKDEGYAAVVLTNLSDAEKESIINGALNMYLGDPLNDEKVPYQVSDEIPEDLTMYLGRFQSSENVGIVGDIRLEDGRLVLHIPAEGSVNDLVFVGGTSFLVINRVTGKSMGAPSRFYVRDGKAWGVSLKGRICQRVD